MIRIHKEGTVTILIILVAILIINYSVHYFISSAILSLFLGIVSVAFFIFILSFFRNPVKNTPANSDEVISPCDGKVVVIEETNETEYFNGRRIQVSIFMSPLNVHVNYNPISGDVMLVRYYPGKHMVAWHPKSSTENERNLTVIADGKNEILVTQIAGTVARRIVCYLKQGMQVIKGKELGFIKFGSRVDLFFPVDAEILVKLDQQVTGGVSVIGRFNSKTGTSLEASASESQTLSVPGVS